jgi:hypothetical protein
MASNTTTVQIPSLCIPRMFVNFPPGYIEEVFCNLFGPNVQGNSCVECIDLITREDRKTGEPFQVAFLHFVKDMPASEELVAFIQRIDEGQEVKIEYRFPWFWKVRKNMAINYSRRGPRIMSAKDEEDLRNYQKKIALKKKTEAAVREDEPTEPAAGGDEVVEVPLNTNTGGVESINNID